jgi:thymidine phosphorylase
LDKLEAIPGWRASLSNAEMLAQLESVGAVICAAGSGLAPADKKLYALRDVTATVESIPMISASIMSKKIAEGTASLVLDVKTGAGAFMKTFEQSKALAETMVGIGIAAGVNTVALITDMEAPLGRSAGNGLEVAESVEVLAGGGPSDVVELTLALAREMLACAGIDADPAEALASGRAMDTWKAMIRAQGGDPDAPLAVARHTEVVAAESDGYIASMDAMGVGLAAWRLGAGRAKQGEPVQAAAGVTWHVGLGEAVRAGQPLFTLHTDTPERIERAREALVGAVTTAPTAPQRRPLVLERVSG